MELYEQAVKLWQSYPITEPEHVDKYLDNFRILFAYHSGKIENEEITYHDTREIFENGRVTHYSGSPRTLLEQQNQKMCYEMLKSKILEKQPLSIKLVKEIHRALTEGTYDERRYVVNEERPGEFKKHDYITGIHEVGASSDEVERELMELIDEINEYDGQDVLMAAAYFHARFQYIHPFADGNGRSGRTLMNYFLMVRQHPPLIIYEEDKAIYYECLQKYDETEDLKPLREFLKYETEKTWKQTWQLTQGIKTGRKGLSDFT